MDSGVNGRVTCRLQDQHRQDDDKFVLERRYASEKKVYYNLFANSSFDRERKNQYQLFVNCRDGGTPQNMVTQDLTIIVDDVNDHTPTFLHSPLEVAFYEGNMPGLAIVDIQARDEDTGLNSQLEYSVEEAARPFVSIQGSTGRLSSVTRFDREKRDFYEFNVTVRDCGSPSRQSSVAVHLKILDINDNAPHFKEKSYEFTVSENATVGTDIGPNNCYGSRFGRKWNSELSFKIHQQFSTASSTFFGQPNGPRDPGEAVGSRDHRSIFSDGRSGGSRGNRHAWPRWPWRCWSVT